MQCPQERRDCRGIFLATLYFTMVDRRFAGKVSVSSEKDGY
ncbi:MAG TPA: hypothetical protein VGU63_06550 [Candidatus Acidoferrales bacterium]|nr:hypothetical protein [Candidatus Acidoferrales bacterium]